MVTYNPIAIRVYYSLEQFSTIFYVFRLCCSIFFLYSFIWFDPILLFFVFFHLITSLDIVYSDLNLIEKRTFCWIKKKNERCVTYLVSMLHQFSLSSTLIDSICLGIKFHECILSAVDLNRERHTHTVYNNGEKMNKKKTKLNRRRAFIQECFIRIPKRMIKRFKITNRCKTDTLCLELIKFLRISLFHFILIYRIVHDVPIDAGG